MAITVTIPNHLKYLLVYAYLNGATVDIILMDTGFVFDQDNHALYADVSASELATGNGYTAGGVALTGIAFSEDDADDRAEVTWSNKSWTASGGSIGPSPGAMLFVDSETDDPILQYIDFDGDKTEPDGGTFTVGDIELRCS
jgi:hypothetical protein